MAKLDRAAISERLQLAREQADITQEEMADILRVHVNSIRNWESVKVRTVPWDRIDEWSAITGRDKAWLLQGEEPKQPVEGLSERLDQLERMLGEVLRRLEDPAQDSPA